MDQHVEADDGVECLFGERDLGGVGADEPSLWNERAGSLDLAVTEVNTNDLVTKSGEVD